MNEKQLKEKRFQDLLKLARMLHANSDEERRDAIVDLLPPDDVIRLDTMMRVLASDKPFAVPYPYEGGWLIKRASCAQYLLHSASMWMLSPNQASIFDLHGARLTIAEMQTEGRVWCMRLEGPPFCRFLEGHEGQCDR